MNRRLTKKDFLTIPNFMSGFRLLLIPVIIALYCKYHLHQAAAGVIVLSAVTDFADGRVARKFHMITDVGKVLDPLADKLTQGAMMLCLLSRFRWMFALLILLAAKESLQLLFGCMVLKTTGVVSSANWYGKASTGVLYAVMICLFLFPHIPPATANLLIALCGAALLTAMTLYGRFFIRVLRDGDIRSPFRQRP